MFPEAQRPGSTAVIMDSGTLYVVATPIGNLEDMTPRAVRVLGEVALVAAEDTRRTLALLNHFNIKNRLLSLNADAERGRIAEILSILEQGKDVAIVTDAGTPAASDPGGAAVAAAIGRGLTVSPIPGASAVIAALSVSGAASARFSFEGFLPRSGRKRREALARFSSSDCPVVFFESPNRVPETLRDLLAACGPERRVSIHRELTKKFEEHITASLEEAASGNISLSEKGEYTLVVMPAKKTETGDDETDAAADAAKIDSAAGILLRHGLSGRDAASAASEILGLPKKQVYDRVKSLENAKSC